MVCLHVAATVPLDTLVSALDYKIDRVYSRYQLLMRSENYLVRKPQILKILLAFCLYLFLTFLTIS